MDYWHKRYTCPYFTSSEKRRVCCEGGSRVSFETGGAASRFMNQSCAVRWCNAPTHRHLTDEYERKEEKNGKDAG